MKPALFVIALLSFAAAAFGQQPGNAPYLDPNLAPEARAKDIVSRMTLEEKVLQMQNAAPAIPRLGVPYYNWWNEALHGVSDGHATVFPQAIGLGATWDTDLVHRIADVISTEARAKYNDMLRTPAPETGARPGGSPDRPGLTFWSPNVNIFRDPRWGRGHETYGEDPFLTSRLGVAFVKGMQGDDPHYLKTVASPKHYAVHSGPESQRHTIDARTSEYDKTNTYLPAFRATVIEGEAASVMCVYNSVDGVPGCASTDLLQKRLRDQWGFNGYVVSDCGAVGDIYRNHKFTSSLGGAAVAAVKAGTDLTCGGEYKSLVDEVKAGTIREDEINRSLERLFVARFRLGTFDPPERVPFSRIPITENDSKEHRQLALEAERKAIVLLKNQGGILPLKKSVRRIAVLGPSADDPIALLGNYNGISSKEVTPLEGIRHQFSTARVRYSLGAAYTVSTPALVSSDDLMLPGGTGHGVQAEYFDNSDMQGEPKLRRTEPRIYFNRRTNDPAVVAVIGDEKYSVRWTGTLTAPATGEYTLAARTHIYNRAGRVRLFVDDKEIVPSRPQGRTPVTGVPGGMLGPRSVEAKIQLEGGRKYAIRLELRQNGPAGTADFSWIPPLSATLAEAEKVVKESDVALVFVGLNSLLEGEENGGVKIPGFFGGDRTSLDLPEPQEKLVETAIATGKPVVVVLTAGSAISANYAAEHAAALLEAWYGGEETGTAIAETLAGVNNPAGRLPLTFYKSTEQLPDFTDYSMKGRTYRYFKGEPLYSFGYGLSYSTFQYSGLSANRTANGAEVRATVKNTSSREGDEVVQLYVSDSAGQETRSLRGFQRIRLRAGESRDVSFTLASDDLPKSQVEVSVGGGQPLGNIPHVKGTL